MLFLECIPFARRMPLLVQGLDLFMFISLSQACLTTALLH